MGGTATATVRRSAVLFTAAIAIVALAIPASASARKPIISYIEGNELRLYDAELDQDATLPVAVPNPAAQFRYSISLDGRYVFFNDAAKKLHLLDRTTGQEVPLPGIDVYANPNFLTVSTNGLLAFDNNANGPAVVYDSATGQFVNTGLPPMNGHRQTKLSGNGQFLASTCGPSAGCVVDLGSDSNPYVQNLSGQTDTGLPDDNASDEEDPCINGDGSLVGWHKGVPNAAGQKNIFLYNRATASFVNLPNLNDPVEDDTFCVLDAAGDYVGFNRENAGFRLYERASASILALPNRPFDTRSTFSAPLPSGSAAPSNDITIGKPKRNRKKGTAKLPVTLPGPGLLLLSGDGLKQVSIEAGAAGEVIVKVKAKGRAKDKLRKKGKAKVSPSLTFTPTGGEPNVEGTKFKLIDR
jgi:hypothetical protein